MSTLSSSVSYANGLYTYNYTVDDTIGGAIITEVDVLINGGGYGGLVPIPPSYTAPNGWTMYGAFSGYICNDPYDECGGFYEFVSHYSPINSIEPGQIVTGFSVTTPYAPSTTTNNDYFLYGCPSLTPNVICSVQAYGNVIVPSAADWVDGFPIIGAPLPSAWSVMLAGLLLMGAIYARTNHLSKAAN